MTAKPSISLSDDEHAYALSLVKEGRFSSLRSVLREGLRRLREHEETERTERQALAQLLEERRRGASVSSEEMDSRLDAMIARKRRERGLAD